MNIILEIHAEGAKAEAADVQSAAILHADAILLTGITTFRTGQAKFGAEAKPVFGDWTGTAEQSEVLAMGLSGFVATLANGQPDLDRISAELRVAEARRGLSDGHFKLIGVPFPDLAALADEGRAMRASARLFALAHDETRLKHDLVSDGALTPAPLVYARAKLVAHARKIGRASFLKPDWTDSAPDNIALARQAKADGFSGLIAPPRLAAMIKNM